MSMKQVILDAIAQEKTEVIANLDALNAQIQALQDQLSSGEVITADDLEEIKAAVNNIYTPEA